MCFEGQDRMSGLPNKALLRVDEVAAYFRVSRRTVYSWIDKGDLVAERLRSNGSFRIRRESVGVLLGRFRYDPDGRYAV